MLDHNIELMHTSTKVSVEHFTFANDKITLRRLRGTRRLKFL